MANDFTNAIKTAYRTFHESANDFRASWMTLTDPIVEQRTNYQEAEVFGMEVYAAQVDSPTPNDFDSAKTSVSMAQFERVYKIKFSDLKDITGLMQQASELATMGWLTVTQAFWDALKTLDSTTHPYNAESWLTAQGGGTVYYCDAITVTPVNGTAFNQDNVYTTALSDAGLNSGIVAHDKFKNWSGNPLNTAGQAPILIYPADLTLDAKNIVDRRAEISFGNNSGTPVKGSSFDGRLAGDVKIMGNTPSAVDWFLWWKSVEVDAEGGRHNAGPIRPWVRTPPQVRFEKSTTSNHFYMIGYMEYAIFYSGRKSNDVIMFNV